MIQCATLNSTDSDEGMQTWNQFPVAADGAAAGVVLALVGRRASGSEQPDYRGVVGAERAH